MTQSALSTASKCLDALIEAAFDALIVVDARRNITRMNPPAREIFEVGIEVVGQPVLAVTRNSELDAMISQLFNGVEVPEMQITIGDRTFRIRGTAAEDQAILILQDVTELLRLTRARRDMVANISHDLKTPISSMRLLVDSLMLNLGKNPERDMKNLGKIASMTDSLQHMTEELIDLSMIESGQAIMRMVNIDFLEILQSAIRVMETQIDEKKLTLVNKVRPGAAVLADADQIRRVLTNLLHNAVKFTPSGGQIRFTAKVENQMVTVRIADTGPGIPPPERQRVFERFYQVDSTRTGGGGSKSKGTGLGLAIAKHIVEAHGGKIWAEPNEPSGTIMAFTLPLADTPTPAKDK